MHETLLKEVEEPPAELSVQACCLSKLHQLQPHVLQAKEMAQIMAHPHFEVFFARAALLVERSPRRPCCDSGPLGVRRGGRERPDAKPVDARQEAWDIVADFTGGDAGGGDTDVERMKHMDDYVEKKKEPGSAKILHAKRAISSLPMVRFSVGFQVSTCKSQVCGLMGLALTCSDGMVVVVVVMVRTMVLKVTVLVLVLVIVLVTIMVVVTVMVVVVVLGLFSRWTLYNHNISRS